MEEKVQANKHESYGTLTLISVVIPLIGVILGIVYLTKSDKLDRKLGEHLIAVGIFATIVWAIAYPYIMGGELAI